MAGLRLDFAARQRLSQRGDAALFDRRTRARVDDVARIRQVHELLAEVKAHGPRPGLVGGFLGAVYGQVLIADGAPHLPACTRVLLGKLAPLLALLAPFVSVD